MAALVAGKVAPDFTLPTVDGQPFSLFDALKRGPVVLAFFKITCPVCQYALPFLERLYQGYKGKPVTVVGISQNAQKDTADFLRQFGITFPVALDDPANYKVSNAYGLTNVPTVFYIAADGDIEISSVGWVRSEIADINAKLADHVHAGQTQVFRPGEDVADWKAG